MKLLSRCSALWVGGGAFVSSYSSHRPSSHLSACSSSDFSSGLSSGLSGGPSSRVAHQPVNRLSECSYNQPTELGALKPIDHCVQSGASGVLPARGGEGSVFRERRLYKSLCSIELASSLVSVFEGSAVWITRKGYEKILNVAYGRQNVHDSLEIKALPREVKLAPGQAITVNVSQARDLIDQIGDLMVRSVNVLKCESNVLDHAVLLLKPGITFDEVVQVVQKEAGEMGARLFSALFDVNEGKPTLPLTFDDQSGELLSAQMLDMHVWQRRYVNAMLRRLDIHSIVDEVCQSEPLDSLQPFKLANQKILQKRKALAQMGEMKTTSWLTPSMNLLVYIHMVSEVLRKRFQKGVSGQIPGFNPDGVVGKAQGAGHKWRVLTALFRKEGISHQINAVADAIDKGLINVQLLTSTHFHEISSHFEGRSLLGICYGFAVGPHIFIWNRYAPDGQREQLMADNHQLHSIILHEAVHALDSYTFDRHLSDVFNRRKADSYNLERRAFFVQRQYLHHMEADFELDSPDPDQVSDLKHMRSMIKALYGCENLTAFRVWSAHVEHECGRAVLTPR